MGNRNRHGPHQTSRRYSAFTPAALITRAQRPYSFFRNAANSAGESPTVFAPRAFSRALLSGFARDLRISSFRRLTTAAGVPAGTIMPTHGAVSVRSG